MTIDDFGRLTEVAGPVSRETFEALKSFERMFLIWARRINLSSTSSLDDIWNRHILDSAQLWPLLSPNAKVLDLGSGGGFPGLVLGFLQRGAGSGQIALVDSNRKKTAFLQAVIGEFSLPARVYARRIESDALNEIPADLITARALAPLDDLLRLTFPRLSTGARGLFHKGRDYPREIQESSRLWEFELIEHASKTDSAGVILEVSNLRRREAVSTRA